MPFVRAKEDCYVGNDGYRAKGEEFDYSGPKHDSLEVVKRKTQEEQPADSGSNEK